MATVERCNDRPLPRISQCLEEEPTGSAFDWRAAVGGAGFFLAIAGSAWGVLWTLASIVEWAAGW